MEARPLHPLTRPFSIDDLVIPAFQQHLRLQDRSSYRFARKLIEQKDEFSPETQRVIAEDIGYALQVDEGFKDRNLKGVFENDQHRDIWIQVRQAFS